MPRRLKREDFENLAAQNKLKWRGPDVVPFNVKTEWECLVCGKVWPTKYRLIQRGSGCPRCAGHERHPPEHFVELGNKRGLPWLGPEVARVSDKTNWFCPKCQEPFSSTYNALQQGSGCPRCGKRALSPRQFRAVGRLRDLDWLGEKVRTTETHERWRCRKCGRTFRATYEKVKRGRRCSHCPASFDRLPTPPAAYKKLAQDNRLRWLGPPVINTRLETQWLSKKCGHTFSSTYELMSRNPGCRVCSKTRRRDSADYQTLGHSRGLRCLNSQVANSRVKTSWTCAKQKHVFSASYQEVKKLVGCPICNKRWRTDPPEKYQALAEGFGIVVWLGPPVVNHHCLTWWQCTRAQHRYQAAYRQVKKCKGRCPLCRKADRAEKAKSTAAPQALSVPVIKVGKQRGDYTKEELAFIQGMHEYGVRTGNRHPTWRQIFQLLISWGYRRPVGQGEVPEPGIAEENQFDAAMETYKRTSGKRVPTWWQVFRVFQGLGYRLEPAASQD